MSQLLPTEFINWALRLLLAQGVIVLFAFLMVVSFSMPHAGDFKPFFLLMAVYYWAIYRPTVMPIAYTFFLGILVDLMAEMPVGLTAFLLVGVQSLVQRSRLFLMGQAYVMVWLGFAIVAIVYALALWFLMSVSIWDFQTYGAFTQTITAAAFSVLIFPLATLLLQAVHRVLPVTSGPLHTVG